MKVITIGLGYIGLPTALMFAKHGAEVVGVDIAKEVITQLVNGELPIEEPGLQELLQETLQSGCFKPSLQPETGDVFIIAVPTPNHIDRFRSCDLSYVKAAMTSILPYLRVGNTVIIESTVSPRTTEDVIQPMLEQSGYQVGRDIFLLRCPERVLPGQILHELTFNNRIIGGVTEACTEKGKAIYKLFVKGKLTGTSANVAELSKLMENTYRDVNIALANELVQIGIELEINALEVIEVANQHPRVNIHAPGPGVGGHCLAVDPYFVIAEAPNQSPLIQTAREINEQMPQIIFRNVEKIMHENNGQTITLLGLAYKGNTDDIRESPASKLYKQFVTLTNYQVRTYAPHVECSSAISFNEALLDSDLAIILCDHDEFKEIPSEAISLMRTAIVFDTKNMLLQGHDFAKHYTLGNLSAMKSSIESMI